MRSVLTQVSHFLNFDIQFFCLWMRLLVFHAPFKLRVAVLVRASKTAKSPSKAQVSLAPSLALLLNRSYSAS